MTRFLNPMTGENSFHPKVSFVRRLLKNGSFGSSHWENDGPRARIGLRIDQCHLVIDLARPNKSKAFDEAKAADSESLKNLIIIEIS